VFRSAGGDALAALGYLALEHGEVSIGGRQNNQVGRVGCSHAYGAYGNAVSRRRCSPSAETPSMPTSRAAADA